MICTKRERFLFEESVINMLFQSLNERVACTGINIDEKIDNTEYYRKYYKINSNYYKSYNKNYYQQSKGAVLC